MTQVLNQNSTLSVNKPRRGRGRRVSVSSECCINSIDPNESKVKLFPKSPADNAKIMFALSENFLCKALSQTDKQHICNAMIKKTMEKGTNIITQGHDGDFFYVLVQGQCEVIVNKNKVLEYNATFEKPCSFGELALMYNCARAASVIALTETTLWVIDRQSFRHIINTKFKAKKTAQDAFLSHCNLFSKLTPFEIAKVSDAMNEEVFERGDVIIQEGETNLEKMKFYVIIEGHANILKKNQRKRLLTGKRKSMPIVRSLSRNNCFEPLRTLVQERDIILPPLTPRTNLLNHEDPQDDTCYQSEHTIRRKTTSSDFQQDLIGELTVGQFFGEKALIEKMPRAATIQAKTKLVCGVLNISSFERILGSCTEILNREIEKYDVINKQHELEVHAQSAMEVEEEYEEDFESSRSIKTAIDTLSL